MNNFLIYKNFDNEINLIDTVENIPGHYGDIDKDFYKTFKLKFWTLDYNAERINGENSIFKSNPWHLFDVYNKNKEKFEVDFKTEYEKKFICLIFNSQKDHRKIFFDFISEQNIDCYLSKVDNGMKLTEIPEYFKHGYYKKNYNYGVPKEYFKALIDIVTESYVKFSSHFSEKSYKPLIHKKVFLTFAGPYYYETMKKYNFELYDEIFDYSFDVNENVHERMQNILFQIFELNKQPFEELKNRIDTLKDKIEYNYQNLFKMKTKCEK